jgi:uncharacterized protein YciI
MRYLAVTMERGPAFDHSAGIREQDSWNEHADYMDALVDEGYVVLGGPIGDGTRVLMIVNAESEDEVHRRFAEDPWSGLEILRVGEIRPWEIWLDARSAG